MILFKVAEQNLLNTNFGNGQHEFLPNALLTVGGTIFAGKAGSKYFKGNKGFFNKAVGATGIASAGYGAYNLSNNIKYHNIV